MQLFYPTNDKQELYYEIDQMHLCDRVIVDGNSKYDSGNDN